MNSIVIVVVNSFASDARACEQLSKLLADDMCAKSHMNQLTTGQAIGDHSLASMGAFGVKMQAARVGYVELAAIAYAVEKSEDELLRLSR